MDDFEEVGSVQPREIGRGWAPLFYSAAWGALLYACLEQIASGQNRLAWISGALRAIEISDTSMWRARSSIFFSRKESGLST